MRRPRSDWAKEPEGDSLAYWVVVAIVIALITLMVGVQIADQIQTSTNQSQEEDLTPGRSRSNSTSKKAP
ncbi:MAG: hypothetical protein Q7R62_02710 [bacterium]|nr:hypothetical protein [bacterium]